MQSAQHTDDHANGDEQDGVGDKHYRSYGNATKTDRNVRRTVRAFIGFTHFVPFHVEVTNTTTKGGFLVKVFSVLLR